VGTADSLQNEICVCHAAIVRAATGRNKIIARPATWKAFEKTSKACTNHSHSTILHLTAEFAKHPVACLTLASFLATNTGDVARRHIKDPELLHFIDIECYCWSTVLADQTPMINSGMVFCDRHYGGINYPLGGVGRIPEALAEGLRERGSYMVYKANVRDPSSKIV
jgi:phytoene dehydrogenase-like protein